MNIARPHWPIEDDAQLRIYWEVDGLSASQCSEKMQRTRNSIIGRAHRLKLMHPNIGPHVRSFPRCAWPRKPRGRKPRLQETGTVVARKHVLRRTQSKNTFIWETGELTETQYEPLGPSVSLLELKARHCRWPTIIETGETVYCGMQKVEGNIPYCATHFRMAYQRSPVRISDEERMRRALNTRRNAKDYWAKKSREAA